MHKDKRAVEVNLGRVASEATFLPSRFGHPIHSQDGLETHGIMTFQTFFQARTILQRLSGFPLQLHPGHKFACAQVVDALLASPLAQIVPLLEHFPLALLCRLQQPLLVFDGLRDPAGRSEESAKDSNRLAQPSSSAQKHVCGNGALPLPLSRAMHHSPHLCFASTCSGRSE